LLGVRESLRPRPHHLAFHWRAVEGRLRKNSPTPARTRQSRCCSAQQLRQTHCPGILSTKIVIREQFSEAKVPIAEISDTRNSTSWIPPKCASGHNNIVVDMKCSTCLDGHGTDSARGHYRGDNQPCGYLVEVAIGFMQGAYRMTFEAARRAKAVRRWRLLEMECARRREEAACDRICTTV
jgi:hypothetical protein